MPISTMLLKLLKSLHLILAITLFGMLSVIGHPVNATPITGMVGVGTYNTQADFANVVVTQGTSTLYSSNFSSGMSEWTTLSGTWTTSGGYLHQSGAATPSLALVGNPTWTNYTVTLQARKTGGAEGFMISFGSPGDASLTCWNIGGWGNTLDNLQVPGVWVPSVNQTIQTGVWYTIRIVVSGTDIQCYLNGTLIHDTARVLTSAERQSRFQDLLNSPGYSLLNNQEQAWLTNLSGRSVYIGAAAQSTFSAMPSSITFDALTAAQQVAIICQVNRNRLSWVIGGGFGVNTSVDAAIISSMDSAVMLHNQLGLFDANFVVNNSPSTATADASLGGPINFGSQYSERCALHEISHALGTGTNWNWQQLMVNGVWSGYYASLQEREFDGISAVLNGDTQHYWPYGLNYDSEMSTVNAYRHVLICAALRRDMGIATLDVQGNTAIPNGTYVLVPRHAQTSAFEVAYSNPAAGTGIDISSYTKAANQQFLFDLQSDSTYRIRTSLAGSDCLDLPNGSTANGNALRIWTDNGLDPQHWYLIPLGDSWYRIAPKADVTKAADVNNSGTANGTLVQTWDYLDGLNQQWRLLPTTDLYTTSLANGKYILTPQSVPGSALDVPGSNTANGTQLDISTLNGGANQQFLFDLHADNTYRIRTALSGNACVDLNAGITSTGTIVQLWGDNGLDSQRWYVIPVANGRYRIGAKLNIDTGLDITGGGTANGTPVQLWSYLGGTNQIWSLISQSATITSLSPTDSVSGSPAFNLTVNGSNFVSSSIVRWNGVALTTTFVSASRLTALVPASSIASPISASVTVTDQSGTSVSNTWAYTVAVPSIRLYAVNMTHVGNSVSAMITLTNRAAIHAPIVVVTAASLIMGIQSSAATGLPAVVGTIASYGSGTMTLQFPNWGTPTGTAIIRVTGTYGGIGTFSVVGRCNVPSGF